MNYSCVAVLDLRRHNLPCFPFIVFHFSVWLFFLLTILFCCVFLVIFIFVVVVVVVVASFPFASHRRIPFRRASFVFSKWCFNDVIVVVADSRLVTPNK